MQYTVRQGDCLSSIAAAHGISDWRTIYNAPENALFRTLRPNPNLIYPGDVLEVPDPERKTESGSTEQRHRFRAVAWGPRLRIRVLDQERRALANATYELVIDGQRSTGVTRGDGLIDVPVPPAATAGTLSVQYGDAVAKRSFQWNLRIGALDPIDTVSGMQARMRNLAFDPGPVDGIVGPLTRAGTRAFQATYSCRVDGIFGPETRGAMRREHDQL
jgi:N-acetylmuramoyl-L-alanine amidase